MNYSSGDRSADPIRVTTASHTSPAGIDGRSIDQGLHALGVDCHSAISSPHNTLTLRANPSLVFSTRSFAFCSRPILLLQLAWPRLLRPLPCRASTKLTSITTASSSVLLNQLIFPPTHSGLLGLTRLATMTTTTTAVDAKVSWAVVSMDIIMCNGRYTQDSE